MALNFLEECEIDMSNITLVNTASPAMYDYRLNTSAQSQTNGHFNFYNVRDETQRTFGLFRGGGARRTRVDGRQIGRAQPYPARNVEVYVPRSEVSWWDNNWMSAGAHSIMRTSVRIWDEYKIDEIRDIKGW